MNTPSASDSHRQRLRRSWAKPAIIVLVVVCIAALGASAYFYLKYTKAQEKANEKDQLTQKISALVELPNETPSLVTVTDKSKLQNKQLADKVNNNDVLLILNQNRRIIIYRPSSNKIVDMLTVSASETQVQSQTTKP